MNEYLEKPTFTIGQVWTEFVKRLPRTSPRYRMTGYDAYQQASMQQLAQAAMQAQMNPQQFQPYGFPQYQGSYLNELGNIGNIFGGLP